MSNAQQPTIIIRAAASALSEGATAEPGTGWGRAQLIEAPDARLDFGPQVAVDPRGAAVAVWHQWEGPGYDLWANRFVRDVGWGISELIETDGGYALSPQIATDPQGNAIAVWSQGDGTRDNIWANHFVEDIVPPDRAISPLVIAAGIGAGIAAMAAMAALLLLRSRGKRKGEG